MIVGELLAESWSRWNGGERTGHRAGRRGAFRPTIARRTELAESVAKGRELFYGTQGQLREVPRPDRPGRRPAGRLRQLEQGEQRVHQGDRCARSRRFKSLKAGLDRSSRATTSTRLKQQIDAQSSELQRAAGIGRRRCCRRATRFRAICAKDMYPRRPAAARSVLAHLGRHRRHADAGQRPGRAGRPGHAHRARDLADCRLRHSLPFEPASRPQKRPVNADAVSRGE